MMLTFIIPAEDSWSVRCCKRYWDFAKVCIIVMGVSVSECVGS